MEQGISCLQENNHLVAKGQEKNIVVSLKIIVVSLKIL